MQEKENKIASELLGTRIKIGILFSGFLGNNIESTGFGCTHRQDGEYKKNLDQMETSQKACSYETYGRKKKKS